LKFIIWFK